jgi:hypothetical protein
VVVGLSLLIVPVAEAAKWWVRRGSNQPSAVSIQKKK